MCGLCCCICRTCSGAFEKFTFQANNEKKVVRSYYYRLFHGLLMGCVSTNKQFLNCKLCKYYLNNILVQSLIKNIDI